MSICPGLESFLQDGADVLLGVYLDPCGHEDEQALPCGSDSCPHYDGQGLLSPAHSAGPWKDAELITIQNTVILTVVDLLDGK